MKVMPLHDRVLVRRIEKSEVKRGGIIIPDSAKEKPMEAEIIEVGKGRRTEEGKLIAPSMKKGDKVLIGKYSGTEVEINGIEHLIVREDEVLAKIF
jgi:chaperonin GroES